MGFGWDWVRLGIGVKVEFGINNAVRIRKGVWVRIGDGVGVEFVGGSG